MGRGYGIFLPLDMPTVRYGSPVAARKKGRRRGDPEPEMVLFGEAYRFGGNKIDRRDPGGSSTFNMRFQFSRESFRDWPPLKESEAITLQMYQYSWAAALMLMDDPFLAKVAEKGVGGIDVDDALTLPPDLLEALVDLPLVRSVTLNFTVNTS